MAMIQSPNTMGAVTKDGVSLIESKPILSRFWLLLLLVLLHVFLAWAIKANSAVATVHAYLVLVVSCILAMGSRRLIYAAIAIAYISGSEVLWRMGRSSVFWEYGKYAVVLVIVISLFRTGRLRNIGLPLGYFVLLVPAGVATLGAFPWGVAREMVSFNLSGPLSLMMTVMFFTNARMSPAELGYLLLGFVLPVVGVSTFILLGFNESQIVFGASSNHAASGGFGPNQVSAVLGCASTVLFLLLVTTRPDLLRKVILYMFLALFAAQSALTFSRAGIYYAAAAIAAASLFSLRNAKGKFQMILFVIVLLLLGNYVVFPRLDEMTGGALAKRYSNTNLTGRDEIANADWEIFLTHPILGAGVGQANEARRVFYHGNAPAAHTEYTRLFSEHGLLGVVAMLLLLLMGMRGLWNSVSSSTKSLTIGMAVFGLSFMLGNGMRLALPAFCLGLAQVVLISPEFGRDKNEPQRILKQGSASS